MSDLPLPDPQAEILTEALDIQHDTDPADDHGHARRIPHLGHALLLISLMGFFILICQIGALAAVHGFGNPTAAVKQHPYALAVGLVAAYALTFAVAIPLFRTLWHKPFRVGISWTWRAARLHWWQLLVTGCILSVVAQLLEHFSKKPVTSDIAELLKNPAGAWATAIFGSLIAPIVEEIVFRGFLLPALATAYDWLSLDRTPAGFARWQSTTKHTLGALIFGAIFSSLAFAALHGSQLHWAIAPVAVIFLMSMAFSAIRIQTRSVAAAVLVHIAYDALLFTEVIIVTHGFHNLTKL